MPTVMPKHEKRNFGQLIREQRRRLGLTQREIAPRIGTSTPYLGHLEVAICTNYFRAVTWGDRRGARRSRLR